MFVLEIRPSIEVTVADLVECLRDFADQLCDRLLSHLLVAPILDEFEDTFQFLAFVEERHCQKGYVCLRAVVGLADARVLVDDLVGVLVVGIDAVDVPVVLRVAWILDDLVDQASVTAAVGVGGRRDCLAVVTAEELAMVAVVPDQAINTSVVLQKRVFVVDDERGVGYHIDDLFHRYFANILVFCQGCHVLAAVELLDAHLHVDYSGTEAG